MQNGQSGERVFKGLQCGGICELSYMNRRKPVYRTRKFYIP